MHAIGQYSFIVGVIHPPSFDGTNPVIQFDYRAKLFVPLNHSILVSLVHLDVVNTTSVDNTLGIMQDETRLPTMLYERKDAYFLKVFRAKEIRFVYSYSLHANVITTGFKLRFSFILSQFEPVVVSGDGRGLLNCSTPSYSQWKEHVRCNLHLQCAGRQDERGCPFTDKHCDGDISIAGSCLHILQHSWV